jgi:pimeloyl-ACP methyl ester carboxylesterase
MRALRVIVLIILAIVLTGAVVQIALDRERKTLDAAAREKVPSQFARLSDGITEYKLEGPGNGRTVVLLSGATVPFYIWDSTSAALVANGYRVLRYNYYGRGYSDRPALRYDLATYDRQLTQLLDTLGIRGPVDVAGLSMGGAIAASFADRHPDRVRTLTLVDPAIGTSRNTPLALRIPGFATLAMTLGASDMATGQLDDFVHPERYPDWVRRYEVQMRYKGFRRSILETQRGDVFKRPAASFTTLVRSPIPILLLWGKSDRTVPFARSDSVRAVFQRAEFHAIDDAAHLPNIERAAAVDSIVLEFLRRSWDATSSRVASASAAVSSAAESSAHLPLPPDAVHCNGAALLDYHNTRAIPLLDSIGGRPRARVQNDSAREEFYTLALYGYARGHFLVTAASMSDSGSAGWISGEDVWVYGRNYSDSLILYAEPRTKSRPQAVVREWWPELYAVKRCNGDWLDVRATIKGEPVEGWLPREMQCANPYTTCS